MSVNAKDQPGDVDLWAQYQQLVDLFRFYLDLIIKANVLYTAIAGGIISYVVSQLKTGNGSFLQFALLIPFLYSLGYVFMSSIGFVQATELHGSIQSIGKKLELRQVVHSSLLPCVTGLTSIFHVLLIALLVWLYLTRLT